MAIVDDDDYQYVKLVKWRVVFNPKALKVEGVVSGDRDTLLPLANFILGVRGVQVDHVDRDPLNNTRVNLRVATAQQQSFNRWRQGVTGFKGVHPIPYKNTVRYQARLSYHGKTYSLGCFATALEAAKEYNKEATRMFGEFACLNKIPDENPTCGDVHATAEGNDTIVKIERN